jgi:peptidoglycan/xylan/chitin deacetylase (PgdA/CDA1 family)
MVADHSVVVAASLWPRSTLLGPNLVRLPTPGSRQEVALTFDDGPDPAVTPLVLDQLHEADARATFFCVGQRAEVEPALVEEIVRRGHRVENHSFRHSKVFSFYHPQRLARDIEQTQRVLERLSGHRPRFFRAPAGIRSPWLDLILARRHLHLVSWTRRGFDTVDRDPSRVAGRLIDGLSAGDVLVLHDGDCARDGSGRPVVLEALPRVLDELHRQGLRSVALPDPEA